MTWKNEQKKTRLVCEVRKKWLEKYVFIPKMRIWTLQLQKKSLFFCHQNLKLKSLILHVFWREKWRKKHAFSLWSTKKVIEKVRVHTKDADLNSTYIINTKKNFSRVSSFDNVIYYSCWLISNITPPNFKLHTKPIWVLKISIKTTFSSNRNPKPKSLISMLFLEQIKEENVRFQLSPPET